MTFSPSKKKKDSTDYPLQVMEMFILILKAILLLMVADLSIFLGLSIRNKTNLSISHFGAWIEKTKRKHSMSFLLLLWRGGNNFLTCISITIHPTNPRP